MPHGPWVDSSGAAPMAIWCRGALINARRHPITEYAASEFDEVYIHA